MFNGYMCGSQKNFQATSVYLVQGKGQRGLTPLSTRVLNTARLEQGTRSSIFSVIFRFAHLPIGPGRYRGGAFLVFDMPSVIRAVAMLLPDPVNI